MYKKTIENRMEELESSREGLSSEERNSRRKDFGYNEFINLDKRSFLSFYLESFRSNILRLLLLGVVFFAYLGRYLEAGVFLGIFLFQSIVRSLKSLRAQRGRWRFRQENMNYCRVLQEGQEVKLAMRELIPGDIVILEKGDIIPADGRLIEGEELYIDESILTGSKEPFCKDVSFFAEDNIPLGERANMVYASTVVCDGKGLMLVTSTGLDTEVGKIAFMLFKDRNEVSQTERKIKNELRAINVFICLLVIGLGAYAFFVNLGFLETIFLSFSLLMASCLEGLGELPSQLESRIALRFKDQGMAIKDSSVLEKLAGISVVLFDDKPYINRGKLKLMDLSSSSEEDEIAIKRLALLLASGELKDDRLFSALRDFTLKEDPELDRSLEGYELVGGIKELENGELLRGFFQREEEVISFALGGVAGVLASSSFYKSEGELLEIDQKTRENILAMEAQFRQEGKEVLAFAQGDSPSLTEGKLSFLGLVALGATGNEGAKETVKTLKNAGVLPLMMTELSPEEGAQLAREVGFLIPGYEIIDAEMIDGLSDEELLAVIENYTVYFGMNPKRRQRIISAWQEKGYKLALTCPDMDYLEASSGADLVIGDISSSSSVLRERSDLLIPGDKLSSFGEALAEARMFSYNVRRKLRYELVLSLALLISNFAILLLFREQAFSFMGLLWLGLVIKTLPGLALEKEIRERNVLYQKPPRLDQGPLQTKSLALSIFESLVIALSVVAVYILYPLASIYMLNAMAYLVFGLGILLQAFSLRSSQWVLGRGFFSNLSFFGAFALSALLVVLPLLTPYTASILGVQPLLLEHWLLGLGIALIPLVLSEFRKIFIRE